MTCCCDANEALRRDNADLTVQKDRLIAENEKLRREHEQFLSIEANNGKLRIENEKLERKAAFLQQSVNDTAAMNRELQERNYQLEKEAETLRRENEACKALLPDWLDIPASKRLQEENKRLKIQRDHAIKGQERLFHENETLRQRVASLERDVTHFDSLTKNLHEVGDHLRAENARLKVDLMNARANADTHIWIGDWQRRF